MQQLPSADASVHAAAAETQAADAAANAEQSADAFVIPTLPVGRVLELSIISTWGDVHYVGLSGLELFDASGANVTVRDPTTAIHANPSSVNDLPGYGNDPRTVDKLLNGANTTCSDLHCWLAPFTPGARHTVTLTLDAPIALGMLRVWNYNKSRVHAARGARHVRVTLDGVCVFDGELRAAPGTAAEAHAHAEVILFCTDEPFLCALDAFDAAHYAPAAAATADDDCAAATDANGSSAAAPIASSIEQRPRTAEKVSAGAASAVGGDHAAAAAAALRPRTCANLSAADPSSSTSRTAAATHKRPAPVGRVLRLQLISTWGESTAPVDTRSLHLRLVRAERRAARTKGGFRN
jgi:hypothetical protein